MRPSKFQLELSEFLDENGVHERRGIRVEFLSAARFLTNSTDEQPQPLTPTGVHTVPVDRVLDLKIIFSS